ncbi:MAG: GAF domain-containing protein [Ignavibacteriales bacterium]|nr:GAF domain-containing protein [Ignavibacteriales bacterium]
MEESLITNKALTLDEQYVLLENQIFSLLESNDKLISKLANFCAALKQSFEKISWVGFYFFDGEKLFLGPFQGKVACTNILIGKGVCGTAAKEKRTVIVPNVNEFPGHIICDAESKSEIVVPIVKDGALLAVLDVDSTELDAFSRTDQLYLQRLCSYLANNIFNKTTISF